MILFLIELFLVLAFISAITFRSLIAPSVLVPFIWFFILMFYGIADHGMYELSNGVLFAIFLWVATFYIGSVFFQIVNIKNNICIGKINPLVRDIYFYITLIGFPFYVYVIYLQGTTMQEGNFLFNLRMANTGIVKSEYDLGILAYVNTFAFVCYIIELFLYNKLYRNRFLIVLIINIALAVFSMAKTSIFFLIFPAIIMLFIKKRLSRFKLFMALATIVLLFILAGVVRGGDASFDYILDMFKVYTLGGLPALDILLKEAGAPSVWGMHVFKFFYTFANVFGAGIDLTNTNDIGYAYVPFATNVFTVMYPFAADFGYWGIAIFGAINGAVAGMLYRLITKGVVWAYFLYAFWAGTLCLQFFGEYLFTNLSYIIQLLLLFVLATKFKINRVKIFASRTGFYGAK